MEIIPKESLVRKILAYAETAEIPLSKEQACLINDHVCLMLQWNQRLNLTRITQPDEVLVKHVLDSLLPSRWLPREGWAVDVGTGPGFPGIPLKIIKPGLRMLLLEAQRKKVSFLKVVLARLALKEIQAVQSRWEDFAGRHSTQEGEAFSLITVRALRLEGRDILGLGKLLSPGGILAWWAGPGVQAETLERLTSRRPGGEQIVLNTADSYTLPGTFQPRQFFTWRRDA
ncbi:MAG: 16S rRNA (guanine(527)-N(7))-methyltransferase RsmG [Deltaproteobacteria bacterium]|nr:16S rRNA (guanine(527)-N(7))-methyltransferase RsmG [Deltaproteobacteria bacterium]